LLSFSVAKHIRQTLVSCPTRFAPLKNASSELTRVGIMSARGQRQHNGSPASLQVYAS
jgi:hypothetical protein